jgi:hypothetical protein
MVRLPSNVDGRRWLCLDEEAAVVVCRANRRMPRSFPTVTVVPGEEAAVF